MEKRNGREDQRQKTIGNFGMGIWRPEKTIQVKAIGIVWMNKKLLATEIRLDDGTICGVRPLGGHVEFGERWQDALHREFLEELNLRVQIISEPFIIDNIYKYHGELGHEIVFAAEVDLLGHSFESDGPITFFEDTGKQRSAGWYSLGELDTGNIELYPKGLKSMLQK